jgi:hypothetical protein
VSPRDHPRGVGDRPRGPLAAPLARLRHLSAESFAEVEALAEAVLELEGSPAVGELLAAIRASTPEELEAERQSLFGGSVGGRAVRGATRSTPFGRAASSPTSRASTAPSARRRTARRRAADHVGCELEFLAFLELERMLLAESDDEAGADLVDEIAGSFVRDHAGRWLPAFFAGVREVAKAGSTFAALAALGERAVAEEPSGAPRAVGAPTAAREAVGRAGRVRLRTA